MVPEAETVIDVPFVQAKVGVTGDNGKFMDAEIQFGVITCWRGAHGGARQLLPISITEAKDVVSH